MRFNGNAGPNPSHVSTHRRRRSKGRSVAVGVGIGSVLVAVLAWSTGTGPAGLLDGDADTGVQAEAGGIGDLEEECEAVADIDQSPDCRYVALVNSIQEFWTDEFAGRGASYRPTITAFFSGSVRTDCGTASGQVGPFYCPADHGVYLDLGFFDVLRAQHSGDIGALGEGYVLAHEYGHHVQNLTGRMQNLRPGSGPESDAVRLELQADCYAGVWTHHATRASPSGQALIGEPTDRDIATRLAVAEDVGDDYIEERFQGSVAPELWEHGSTAQRMRWFSTGLESGALEDCDTFSAANP